MRCQNALARSLPDCMLRTRYAIIGAYDSISAIWENHEAASAERSDSDFDCANLLEDVVVADPQQAVLGSEMVDDQRGADARRLGDRPQPDIEAVLAHLIDRGIANPCDGREIVC